MAKKIAYLGDPKASMQEVDWLTSNMIDVSADQLMDLAKQAADRCDGFLKHIRPKITKQHAHHIRELRTANNSLRIIAGIIYCEWGEDWFPPTNQLAGVALCTAAAELLGEDPYQEPWSIAPSAADVEKLL